MTRLARARVTVVIGLLGVALAGCGAGQDALTTQDRPAIPGVNAQEAGVGLRNVRVAFTQGGYQPGDTVPVELGVVNDTDTPVRLVEASSPQATSVAVAGDAGARLEIPGYSLVTTTLVLSGVREELNATSAVPLELSFDNGVTFTLEVPVAPPSQRTGLREPLPLDEGH